MSLTSIKDGVLTVVQNNPLAVAAGVGVASAGVVLGGAAVISGLSKKKKSKTKKGRSRDRKFISREKHERAYQRKRRRQGKKTFGKYYKGKQSRRRNKVYYARKTGQPYVILSSGKAKFIKGKRRKK